MSILPCSHFDLDHAAADVQVALRIRNLDAGFAQFGLDREVQVASITPRPITHFTAPNHELKLDGVGAKLVEKNIRCRVLQCMWVLTASGDQCFAYLVDVAAISDADWNTKTHARIAVGP